MWVPSSVSQVSSGLGIRGTSMLSVLSFLEDRKHWSLAVISILQQSLNTWLPISPWSLQIWVRKVPICRRKGGRAREAKKTNIPYHRKVKLDAWCWALNPIISGHRFNFIISFCMYMCILIRVCVRMCAHVCGETETNARSFSLSILTLRQSLSINLQLCWQISQLWESPVSGPRCRYWGKGQLCPAWHR